MICAIIEFHVRPGAEGDYDAWAVKLHERVQTIDGFISVERFASQSDTDKRLSVSYWRDAEALKAWRDDPLHRDGMIAGKRNIFADYRIVVTTVDREYSHVSRQR